MPNELLNRERLAAVRSIAAERPLRIRITGDCMAPRLRDNAYVWVHARRRYWPGDVLVIRSRSGQLLAHRLIGVYRRHGHWRWLTKADSAPRPDFAVSAAEIVGRLSGGECSSALVSVPFRDRMLAAWRFLRFAAIDRRFGLSAPGSAFQRRMKDAAN